MMAVMGRHTRLVQFLLNDPHTANLFYVDCEGKRAIDYVRYIDDGNVDDLSKLLNEAMAQWQAWHDEDPQNRPLV